MTDLIDAAEAAVRAELTEQHLRDITEAATRHGLDREELASGVCAVVAWQRAASGDPAFGMDAARWPATLEREVSNHVTRRAEKAWHRGRADAENYTGELYDENRPVKDVAATLRQWLREQGVKASVTSSRRWHDTISVNLSEGVPDQIVNDIVALAKRHAKYDYDPEQEHTRTCLHLNTKSGTRVYYQQSLTRLSQWPRAEVVARDGHPACSPASPPGDAPQHAVESSSGEDENRHPTVKVRVNGGETDIDAVIAPLIEEMWRAGIETGMSCQDSPAGWVWIWFPAVADCEQFLSLVADFDADPDSLYNRVHQQWSSDHEERFWRYDIFFDDLSVEGNPEDGTERATGTPEFVGNVSVRFPHDDLPAVLDRVKQFNAADECLGECRRMTVSGCVG